MITLSMKDNVKIKFLLYFEILVTHHEFQIRNFGQVQILGGCKIFQQTADERPTLNVRIFNQNWNGKVEIKSYQAIKSEVS